MNTGKYSRTTVAGIRKIAIAPLRKIVDRGRNEHGSPTETLECGHIVHERQDHIGPTNANRRRCMQCLLKAKQDSAGK